MLTASGYQSVGSAMQTRAEPEAESFKFAAAKEPLKSRCQEAAGDHQVLPATGGSSPIRLQGLVKARSAYLWSPSFRRLSKWMGANQPKSSPPSATIGYKPAERATSTRSAMVRRRNQKAQEGEK